MGTQDARRSKVDCKPIEVGAVNKRRPDCKPRVGDGYSGGKAR